jgi:hypothetical protein
MNHCQQIRLLILVFIFSAAAIFAQERQSVEGFDKVEFYHSGSGKTVRDFRGVGRGYVTAAWWTTQIKTNYVSWKTAVVPEKRPTKFSFIAASSVLPSEFSRGPQARLTVNGKYALTFTIGFTRDVIWKEGEYELKYISKRVEYPFTAAHRQFELNGNSGIYQLSVPESIVEAGKPVVLKVELLPFAGWSNGWFMVKERKDVLRQSMESLEGEIEALRQDMAVANEQSQILATKAYPELLNKHGFQHEVIYANGFRHLHPADLIKLQNGELLIMTREGAEHISNDGDVIMLRSKDGGKTWGERQVIAGIKDVDEREGCGIQLRDGTIVVGIFYNNLYDTNGVYGGSNRLSDRKYSLGAYVITSKDNGHTWSEPNYVGTKDMPFRNLEGPTDAPIEMPDGSILMAVIGYGINGDSKNTCAVMLRSTDQGKSWKYISTIASDPGGILGGFMEPGIIRTKSGRIIAGLRNHGTDHAIYMTYSGDDGKTWAPPQKTAMIGHPVDLIQLSDGRIMATYGIRPGQHTTPGGIRACFSSDNGATWDIATEVPLRSDFLNVDIGYPESLEMADGKVLTVYYYNLFGKYFLGGTWWKP